MVAVVAEVAEVAVVGLEVACVQVAAAVFVRAAFAPCECGQTQISGAFALTERF